MTSTRAALLLERLSRIASSPGAVLDRTDHEALQWAVALGRAVYTRLEAAEHIAADVQE